MDILAICQKIKNFVALRNFSIGVNGKPKMWNISKTADCRAKRTNIWVSGYYSVYIYGTFDARFLELGLGSFTALCKIFDSTIFETQLLQQFSSDFNQTSYKLSLSVAIKYSVLHFWVICQKLKILWHFEIFVNTGPYEAVNFKMQLLPQFSSDVSET